MSAKFREENNLGSSIPGININKIEIDSYRKIIKVELRVCELYLRTHIVMGTFLSFVRKGTQVDKHHRMERTGPFATELGQGLEEEERRINAEAGKRDAVRRRWRRIKTCSMLILNNWNLKLTVPSESPAIVSGRCVINIQYNTMMIWGLSSTNYTRLVINTWRHHLEISHDKPKCTREYGGASFVGRNPPCDWDKNHNFWFPEFYEKFQFGTKNPQLLDFLSTIHR